MDSETESADSVIDVHEGPGIGVEVGIREVEEDDAKGVKTGGDKACAGH
jgi:hypothetical protein